MKKNDVEDHRATAIAYVRLGLRCAAVAAAYGGLASFASGGHILAGAVAAVGFITLGAVVLTLGIEMYRDLTEPFMIDGPGSYIFAWTMSGIFIAIGVFVVITGFALPWAT